MDREDREQYAYLQDRLATLEAEEADLERDGREIPTRLRLDLFTYRMEAEEIRKAGHRAHVADVEKGQRDAREQKARARILKEIMRLNSAPILPPREIRTRREALGARQRDLALMSGLSPDTISRAELGEKRVEDETLRRITLALEDFEAWKDAG